MKRFKFITQVSAFMLFAYGCMAQGNKNTHKDLRVYLKEIEKTYSLKLGIALMHIENGDTLTLNNKYHYPTMSVYKFPVAISVLNQVDKGKLSLNQKIHISKADLLPNTWSPLREKYPEGNVDITLAELLDYTVAKSDNNGCDILFRLMKGTKAVEKYIHSLGIKKMAITTTEEEMAKVPEGQYTNWTEPFEMVKLLKGFYEKKYLSDSSNRFLMKLMVESSNSANRIKGKLPEAVEVAHKTGTGNKVVNDVGIITLPDGKHVALAVFIDKAAEEFETSEWLIATVAKTVYDYFVAEEKIKTGIDSMLNDKTKKPFNGVILVTEMGEVKYSKIVGYADIEKKKKLNENSQFVIGSISKQITAVIVLREVEKGRLELHAPIKKYLPELKMSWADSVTVHHLLVHMHGIAWLDKPLLFAAGSRFDYGLSNTGYLLLSKIVERTSGQSFAQLSMELFKKCGMKNSFHPDVKKYKNLVRGYTEQEDGTLKFDSMSFQNAPAAGSFISTANDLRLWNEHLHEDSSILKYETYQLMVHGMPWATRQHPVFGNTVYGYGITVSDSTDVAIKYGQTGFAPGFVSLNFHLPVTATNIIILENISYYPFTVTTVEDALRKKFAFHKAVFELVRDNRMFFY